MMTHGTPAASPWHAGRRPVAEPVRYGVVQLTVGAGVLGPLATNPNVVVPLAATVPLCGALRTEMAPEVPLGTPFQTLVVDWPLWSRSATVQLVMAVAPLLRTVTSAWNPPCHQPARRYVAEHPPG